MSKASLIAKFVGVADKITKDLQTGVTHESRTGQDNRAKPSFAAGVTRQALVEYGTRLMQGQTGDAVLAIAKVTILASVAVNIQDRITLPDGRKGLVVSSKGVTNPMTGLGYAVEAWITKE